MPADDDAPGDVQAQPDALPDPLAARVRRAELGPAMLDRYADGSRSSAPGAAGLAVPVPVDAG